MEIGPGSVLARSGKAVLANLPALIVIAALLFTPVFLVSLIVGPGAVDYGFGTSGMNSLRHGAEPRNTELSCVVFFSPRGGEKRITADQTRRWVVRVCGIEVQRLWLSQRISG